MIPLADADTITTILTAAQAFVAIPALIFLGLEFQRERKATQFQAYSQVSDAYAAHLWLAADRENADLDTIWEPWGDDEPRRQALQAKQDAGPWGAWYAMEPHERRCYRYTRGALEIFERAWHLHEKDVISDETWEKWVGWIVIWKNNTRYFEWVFEDTRKRLITKFCATVAAL